MNSSRDTIEIDVAPLTDKDLPVAADLSRAVQWPHRLEDWQFVLALGQGVAAFTGGRLVGTAMAWDYERAVARVGMVLVDPSIQRAGIGGKLMDALLSRVDAPALVLNATEAGEPLYARMGFKRTGVIRQHQGLAAALSRPPELGQHEQMRSIRESDVARLVELDAAALGVRRPHVIEALIRHGDGIVLATGNDIVGFAFCRRFGRGHVVGPVVAQDQQAAQAMMAYWVTSLRGQFVRADVPAGRGLSSWLDGLGLVRCSEVNTMCRGEPPQQSAEFKTFALVNQAIG